jgi:hypothetical protein
MSHSRRACLYAKGGVGVPVDLEEGFGACSSYSQWISGVESLKKTLNKQMKDFAAGVLGNVDTNAGGALLAKALMADVKAQWYEVVSWVDEFYKQLTEEANFKARPAWRLVGRCVAAIFDAMNTVRAKVALIKDPRPLENKAWIIWCVLQCYTIMHCFINLKFQGHPIIVKEITMFMVTERVDPEELVDLQSRLIESENKTTTRCNQAMKKMEENYNLLKRAFDNLQNEFKPIKAKVNSKS